MPLTISIAQITAFLDAGGYDELCAALAQPAMPYQHPLSGHRLTAAQRERMAAVLASDLTEDTKTVALVIASCADDDGLIDIDER